MCFLLANAYVCVCVCQTTLHVALKKADYNKLIVAENRFLEAFLNPFTSGEVYFMWTSWTVARPEVRSSRAERQSVRPRFTLLFTATGERASNEGGRAPRRV